MKTPLLLGERLQKESRAYWWRGIEAVGGCLYCTERRLLFESHKFNFQRGTLVVELSQLVEVRLGGRKIFRFFPMYSNCLQIQRQDDTTCWFLVGNMLHWIAVIDRLKTAAK